MPKINVAMTVNGKAVSAEVEPRTLLIHFLRENLSLTGPHIGCDTTHCGACTVDLDGKSVKSCTMFAVQAQGAEILTIEGMAAPDGKLHALAGRLSRDARAPVRLLHAGHDHARAPPVAGEPEPVRGRNPVRHFRQPVPLHRLPEHRQGDPIRRRQAQRDRIQGSRGMNAPTTPSSLERADKLQGMGCKRKRVEDVRFTQGKGNYVDDIKLPGMLHGDFHRSSHGHARIVKIDTSKAKALPGVLAVLTAEDLKGVNLAWMPTLAGDVQMVLADGKVLFQNQEIAFVVATDRYIAADAADLVEVEYEPLPVVVDPFKAMDADAPILREDIKDKTEGAHGPRKHPNHIFTWAVGDRELTDAAFAKAEVATKDLLSYQRVHPCPLETCQCVVSFNKITGDLTIYGTFQAPHVIRTVVALIAEPAGAEDPCDLARHRRRLRQQGRRLSGLHLRGRRFDRHRPARQMGRGPDREPFDHLFRPRLSHDDRNRRDEGRPGHRRCACISSPTTAPSTPAPIHPSGPRASPISSRAHTTFRSRTLRSTASTPTRRQAASLIAVRSA